jgi:Flp pilus assembly protein TadB
VTVLTVTCAVVAALVWPPAASRWVVGRCPSGVTDTLPTARRPTRRAGRTTVTPGDHVGDLQEVADALVLVALGLRAGLPVVESLEQAASTARGSAGRDLAAVSAALRWGRPTAAAWCYAAPVWRVASLAFQMAEATGAGPADLIEAAAERLREDQERDRERRAARAAVLLVLPLGFGFLPAFACTAVVPLVAVLAEGALGGAS